MIRPTCRQCLLNLISFLTVSSQQRLERDALIKQATRSCQNIIIDNPTCGIDHATVFD